MFTFVDKLRKALTHSSLQVNEAFAPQCAAVQRELKIPDEKLNVSGGAIALGHPLAASGARISAHLVHEMRYMILLLYGKITDNNSNL